MPLYKTITVSPQVKLYVWKVDETEFELKKDLVLSTGSDLRLQGMKSEMHRRAYLSIRHLLALAGYSDEDLFYDSSGKPHLRDGGHISISHSFHYTGIIVSYKQEAGIDIEKQRSKILRIAHKFTTFNIPGKIPNEQDFVSKLTILWGAKESLYKIYATSGLSFLKNIFIADFNIAQKKDTTAYIKYGKNQASYFIYFFEFDGFTCVYALQSFENLLNKKNLKKLYL